MGYENHKKVSIKLPYIPSFLAFREVPVYMELLEELRKEAPHYMPDLLMVDGNGILHPRGFGVASHIGVLANTPSIGIAKSLHCFDGLSNEGTKTSLSDLLERRSKNSMVKGNSNSIEVDATSTSSTENTDFKYQCNSSITVHSNLQKYSPKKDNGSSETNNRDVLDYLNDNAWVKEAIDIPTKTKI